MLRHARLLLSLRVPLPVRLRGLLQVLRLLHNPPRLVGFRLALLRLAHVMTRLRQIRRPVKGKVSRQLVTPLPHGWLTSFTRSALILALSSMRRLRDAVLRPGSASLRLRPLSSASDCILAWLRYRRRWLLGRRLWLAVPSHCRVPSLRVRALTPWRMTLYLLPPSLLTLPFHSLRVPGLWDPGVGVLSPFVIWKG